MARRGKRRATVRRKTKLRARQRGLTKNKTTVPLGLGFPRRTTMTLRYAQQGIMTTGAAGAMTTYNFRANGMFDPDGSFGGHQPMYFDQMMALYDHYIVIGSKMTVTFAQADTTPTTAQTRIPVCCGVFINDDQTTTPGINGVLENSRNNKRTFNLNAGQSYTMSLGWSAKKVFGGSVLGNASLVGTATVNPAEEQFFTLFADSAAMLDATDVYYRVQIDYIAVFNELKDITES